MTRTITTFLVSLVVSFPIQAADSYTVDPRHTFPSFEINHLGFSMQRGRFNETSGKIILDSKAGTGDIQIKINSASISTGLADLEKHLRSPDFLDSEQYPEILFKSSRLHFNKDSLTEVEGLLTLHGETKPVRLTVDHFHCGIHMISLKNICGANATTTIKRSDFGVDKYAPALADEVHIEIQIEAIKD